MSGIPGGGDVMEQMIKVSLNGVEHTLKLVAKVGKAGAKALALLAALLTSRGDRAIMGKTNAYNLVKDGHEISALLIHADDRKRFEGIAKDLKIPFATVKSRETPQDCNVLFREADRGRINQVLERMNYRTLDADTGKKKNIFPSVAPSEPYATNGKTTFDLKETAQQLGIDLKEALQSPRLLMEHPQLFAAYQEMQGRLYDYSAGNKKLIFEQAPDAIMVLSRSAWRALGREVKPDAEKIMVQKPGAFENGRPKEYSKVPVYDISATWGADVARLKAPSEAETGELVRRLERNKTAKVEYAADIPEAARYHPDNKTIQIRPTLPAGEMFILLALEKAHAYLHQRQGESYSRTNAHMEAQAIACQVCAKQGIQTDFDFAALKEWASDKSDEQIQSAMKAIESGASELNKEITPKEQEKTQSAPEKTQAKAPDTEKER